MFVGHVRVSIGQSQACDFLCILCLWCRHRHLAHVNSILID